MYLSKKDLDFLIHLHDDVICMPSCSITIEGIDYTASIANMMPEEDYVYFTTMILRLVKEQKETNKRVREYIAKRRKVDKNYARPKR